MAGDAERAGTDRLFRAFFTTKPGDMGLGLAISRTIIESHGGRLWAEPNDGPGVTFASAPAAGLTRVDAPARRAIKPGARPTDIRRAEVGR